MTMAASGPTSQPTRAATSVGLDQTLDGVVRQHDRFQHRRLREPVDAGLVGDLLLHQRRTNVAGVDAVARHPVRTTLQRGHLGQPLESVLGGYVRGLVRRGAQAVHRGHVHDPAVPVGVHVRQGRPDQPERRFHHDHQHRVEDLRIQFLNGADPLQPGVVDQDVHLELDAAQGCRVAEVQLPRLAPGFGGHRPRPGQIKISDLHRDAQPGEPAGNGGTDSAGAAGDQRGAALQP